MRASALLSSIRAVLALVLVASTACRDNGAATYVECRNDDDCNLHEHCVSQRCLSDGIMLDSGVHDGAATDLGVRDSGLRDAGAALDAAPLDTGPRDAAAPDATPPADTGPRDALTPDADPPDAGSLDASPNDAGSLDASAPDAAPLDAGLRDAGAVDAGPVARGAYDFQRITQMSIPITHELTHVAVSPDDRRAVVSERYDVLYVLDVATHTTSISARLPKDASEPVLVESIAFAPDGSYLLIAATAFIGTNNTPEARLYRASPTLGGLARVGSRISGRHFQAIAFDLTSSTTWILGYNDLMGGSYLATLQTYDDAARTITFVDQRFVSAGCQGIAIADDGLGGRGVVYTCGINGAEVGVYSFGAFMPSGMNTGNTSHVAARPQGDYALAVSWSGGRLARFDRGVWTVGFGAPSLNSSSTWNIAFSSDGARALVTGGYLNGSATLREYRHGAYSTNEISDVSIPGFDVAPWLGSNGVTLDEVAWRPSGDCGYIVGGCSTISCSRGYLVRFSVLNGRPCP